MAVISGLNNSAVTRLKWTHAKLSQQTKDVCVAVVVVFVIVVECCFAWV